MSAMTIKFNETTLVESIEISGECTLDKISDILEQFNWSLGSRAVSSAHLSIVPSLVTKGEYNVAAYIEEKK